MKNDWVSGGHIREAVFSSPGRLVLPIDPTLSTRVSRKPVYLFESSVLRAFAARLVDLVAPQTNKSIAKFDPTNSFPYRESHGEPCMLCMQADNHNTDLLSTDPHRSSLTLALIFSTTQLSMESLTLKLVKWVVVISDAKTPDTTDLPELDTDNRSDATSTEFEVLTHEAGRAVAAVDRSEFFQKWLHGVHCSTASRDVGVHSLKRAEV
ncbi:hypothetical protein GGX14DRAFT_580419 [Mycena pura]|uniref:Uncharacterized protein n=1 Tax=Mycena pura TaxID=153505 RepID=A0AAD6XVV8_9AGAR|nr:hypothetical protein GGX14DRAFT_580419 [Mycena pura]